MLELLDYRRQVHSMYQAIRAANSPADARAFFCAMRDRIFSTHPQSALDEAQQAEFVRLRYYDYDPAYRVTARVDRSVEQKVFEVNLDNDGQFKYRRFGQVEFTVPTGTGRLSVFWIEGYGGGVFLPFADATSNKTTYGGGRYLLDTIKGADLGGQGDELILDFNFAYNPSCAYNPRWVCPLSPRENRLPFEIPVGEYKFLD